MWFMGVGPYGRVDRVPGVACVVTMFVHFLFMPLIPYQSLVVPGDGLGSRGAVRIPMSLKSVAVGYLRAALILAAVLALAAIALTIFGHLDDKPLSARQLATALAIRTIVVAAGIGLYVASRQRWMASPARRAELCRLLGRPECPATDLAPVLAELLVEVDAAASALPTAPPASDDLPGR